MATDNIPFFSANQLKAVSNLNLDASVPIPVFTDTLLQDTDLVWLRSCAPAHFAVDNYDLQFSQDAFRKCLSVLTTKKDDSRRLCEEIWAGEGDRDLAGRYLFRCLWKFRFGYAEYSSSLPIQDWPFVPKGSEDPTRFTETTRHRHRRLRDRLHRVITDETSPGDDLYEDFFANEGRWQPELTLSEVNEAARSLFVSPTPQTLPAPEPQSDASIPQQSETPQQQVAPRSPTPPPDEPPVLPGSPLTDTARTSGDLDRLDELSRTPAPVFFEEATGWWNNALFYFQGCPKLRYAVRLAPAPVVNHRLALTPPEQARADAQLSAHVAGWKTRAEREASGLFQADEVVERAFERILRESQNIREEVNVESGRIGHYRQLQSFISYVRYIKNRQGNRLSETQVETWALRYLIARKHRPNPDNRDFDDFSVPRELCHLLDRGARHRPLVTIWSSDPLTKADDLALGYSIFRAPHNTSTRNNDISLIRRAELWACDHRGYLLPEAELAEKSVDFIPLAEWYLRKLVGYAEEFRLTQTVAAPASFINSPRHWIIRAQGLAARAVANGYPDFTEDSIGSQLDWFKNNPELRLAFQVRAARHLAATDELYRQQEDADHTNMAGSRKSTAAPYKKADGSPYYDLYDQTRPVSTRAEIPTNSVLNGNWTLNQRFYYAIHSRMTLQNLPPSQTQLEDADVLLIFNEFVEGRVTKAFLHDNWSGVFTSEGYPAPCRRPMGRPGVIYDEVAGRWAYAVIAGCYTLCGGGHLKKLLTEDQLNVTNYASHRFPWQRPGQSEFTSYDAGAKAIGRGTSPATRRRLVAAEPGLDVDWDAIEWPTFVDPDSFSPDLCTWLGLPEPQTGVPDVVAAAAREAAEDYEGFRTHSPNAATSTTRLPGSRIREEEPEDYDWNVTLDPMSAYAVPKGPPSGLNDFITARQARDAAQEGSPPPEAQDPRGQRPGPGQQRHDGGVNAVTGGTRAIVRRAEPPQTGPLTNTIAPAWPMAPLSVEVANQLAADSTLVASGALIHAGFQAMQKYEEDQQKIYRLQHTLRKAHEDAERGANQAIAYYNTARALMGQGRENANANFTLIGVDTADQEILAPRYTAPATVLNHLGLSTMGDEEAHLHQFVANRDRVATPDHLSALFPRHPFPSDIQPQPATSTAAGPTNDWWDVILEHPEPPEQPLQAQDTSQLAAEQPTEQRPMPPPAARPGRTRQATLTQANTSSPEGARALLRRSSTQSPNSSGGRPGPASNTRGADDTTPSILRKRRANSDPGGPCSSRRR